MNEKKKATTYEIARFVISLIILFAAAFAAVKLFIY